EMKKAGSINISQDEKSCVVYGMPKEAVNIGAVDHVQDIYNIANKTISLLETM
ncbi:MAG: chemotaxis response regulator protein-glutamate methylesterase, partial [Desulfobacteraceae bacterium]|nr:chemotaxis response regulator protein-glutamate methylesterase [Desulfobacteraceae bacterium]